MDQQTSLHYQVYGLTFDSVLEFPELVAINKKADICIYEGGVPDELDRYMYRRPLYQIRPGSYLLNIPNIARYLVKNGNEVIIESYPGANKKNVRLFFYPLYWGF